jgi:Kef-type K+ transport system membrane component KefB
MNDVRPPVRLTARALTIGSLAAAAILGLGLVLDMAGQSAIGKLVGNIGVIVLLATPAAGLIATWSELRRIRPTHAWLAVAVLVVLVLATIVSTAARV